MTYIISEIASAHNGKADNLKKLIDASINSNADAVKIQIFKTENLLQKKHKNYKLFKKIEISHEKIFNILERVSDKKIDLILEPYDFDSLKFIKKIKKFHSIKIPTSDTKNLKFIKEASKVKKKIFLGIAGLKLNEIKKIINMLKKNQLNLVHGFQSFPTKFLDTDVSRISILKKIFKKQVCYADHSDSENLGICYSLCSLAIINGASIIEKHITLNRKNKGPDYHSALNPNEFKNFVDFFKKYELLIKNKKFKLSNAEHIYSTSFKKYPLASRDLQKGTIINEKDINFKRIDANKKNFLIDNYYELLGKKLLEKKKCDTPFFKKNFK